MYAPIIIAKRMQNIINGRQYRLSSACKTGLKQQQCFTQQVHMCNGQKFINAKYVCITNMTTDTDITRIANDLIDVVFSDIQRM